MHIIRLSDRNIDINSQTFSNNLLKINVNVKHILAEYSPYFCVAILECSSLFNLGKLQCDLKNPAFRNQATSKIRHQNHIFPLCLHIQLTRKRKIAVVYELKRPPFKANWTSKIKKGFKWRKKWLRWLAENWSKCANNEKFNGQRDRWRCSK